MPREVNGVPLSHRFSYRFFKRQWFLDTWAPRLSEWLFNRVARGAMDRYLGPVDPSWGLHDAHSIRATSPVISDNIISNLRSGTVESVAGVRRITGPRQVQLTDGRHVGVDAIICCTGYENKFSVLAPEHDPTAHMPRAWIEAPGSKGRALPRLYQNVFTMEAPDSLVRRRRLLPC
jgi:dimethylaniline monooxygenase (N-oxide forming)